MTDEQTQEPSQPPDARRRPGRMVAGGLALVLLLGATYAAGDRFAGGPATAHAPGHGASDDPHLDTEDGHDHGAHEGTEGDPAVYDPGAAPGPQFRARDATLPPAPPGREHKITLTVRAARG